LTPSTSKPLSRQPLKSLPSANNSGNQTNRAVELRRARAQAKIEELSQRSKKQFHKSNHPIDVMSASWHSNASSTNKKDFANIRTTTKTNIPPKQDLSVTRTIYHRSSSFEEKHDEQYQNISIDEVNKIEFFFSNMNKWVMYLRNDVIHYVMMDKD